MLVYPTEGQCKVWARNSNVCFKHGGNEFFLDVLSVGHVDKSCCTDINPVV